MDAALADWLAKHHGVVSRSWLRNADYSEGRIRVLLESGQLVSMQRGVYATPTSPQTTEQRIVVLALAYDAAASHQTAGHLWGFRRLGTETVIHATIRHGRSIAPRVEPTRHTLDERAARRSRSAADTSPAAPTDLTIHRSRNLRKADTVRRNDGVVLTTPVRTVFDLALTLPAEDLESVLEQCLSDGRFTLPTLRAVGKRLGASGREGTKRFNDLLGTRNQQQRPLGSHLELRFERAWTTAGLPGLERQRPFPVADGKVLHPDFAEPSRRFLVEIDHAAFHGGHHDNMADRWRDRQFHLAGWHCERVSNTDVDERLPEVIAQLEQIYRARPIFGVV